MKQRSDHGASLIEVVVALTLVALVVIPLLRLAQTTVRASGYHRHRSEANALLASAGAAIATPSTSSAPCDSAISDYQGVIDRALKADLNHLEGSVRVAAVHTWNGDQFIPVCENGSSLQRLELEIPAAPQHRIFVTKRANLTKDSG